jgi:hypothetical protein
MTLKQKLATALCFLMAAFCAGCRGAEQHSSTTNTTQPATSPAMAQATPAPFIALPQDARVLQTRTFTSAKQKTYTIQTVEDDREVALRAQPSAREALPMAAAAAGSDKFNGTARKAAKLSLATAPLETFGDLPALIASLAPEAAMKNHVPPITTAANSNRVAEEKRNAHLKVFLYAASKEDDNDFHLILGRAPGSTPAVYLTMELSGLPPNNSAAFAKLKAARDAFKAFFVNNSLPGANYDFYTPPIPVEIEGSLFFDINHVTGGRPGPASLRPKMPVVWEVHTISKIVFEPE